jgi:hypothetical protein
LFTELVKILKETGKIKFTPEEVYDVLKNFKFNLEGATNYNSLLDVMGEQAINSICEYFTTLFFEDTRKWIRHSIEEAILYRKSNPMFFIELCKGGKLSGNPAYERTYNKLGAPLVTNQADEAFVSSVINHSSTPQPEYLFAINQAYKLFYSNAGVNRKCQLKGWCQESCFSNGIADFTDDRCDTEPWQRALDSDKCTFGHLWYAWGLSNKSPQP